MPLDEAAKAEAARELASIGLHSAKRIDSCLRPSLCDVIDWEIASSSGLLSSNLWIYGDHISKWPYYYRTVVFTARPPAQALQSHHGQASDIALRWKVCPPFWSSWHPLFPNGPAKVAAQRWQ